MTTERTCPHCGEAVPADRLICPKCFRTLPSTEVASLLEQPVPPEAQPAAPPTGEAHAPALADQPQEVAGPPDWSAPEATDQQPAAGPVGLPVEPPAESPQPTAPAWPPPPGVYQAPPGAYQPPPTQYPQGIGPAAQPGLPPPAGYPPGYAYPGPPPPPRQDDTMAIVGLIMSILGIACCGCLSILCPVGLILSIVAHHKRSTGVTLAGIILGIIGTLLFLASTIWSVWLTTHPEMYEDMIRRMFEQMGIPMPSGFPRPF